MPRFSRRRFVQSSLSAMLAAAVAPQFIASRLLGENAPSKRVSLGFIGVGSHGVAVNLMSFLYEPDCVVRVVCDVFGSKAAKAKEIVDQHYGNADCIVLRDFRAVLARADIDAVVISTPDHWHVPMALLALEAGKMVFCEKPTLTIQQGRQLAAAVQKSGLLFATGIEDRAVIQYHMLAEAVRNGAIGQLKHIEVGLVEKPIFPAEDPAPVPADLNYEMWLGPAPFRPFTPRLTEDQVWRQVRDFSGGSLTDWGAHLVDTAQVANFSEDSSPVAVEGTGVIPPNAINSVPQTYRINYRYANGVTMAVASTGVAIRFEGTEGWVGNKGWLGRLEGSNMDVFRRKYDPAVNKLWPRRPREQRDFLDSIKSGQPPMYTAEALHRLSTTLHLGALAMELKRPLTWDPKAEIFTGDDEANALRARPQRIDWQRA
ncbi:MAG: Gfo/Idh/MocA family oxidoreductase [Opitutus sp.]